MKKFLPSFLIALALLVGINKFVLAEGANVSLTVKNNGDAVYSGTIALSSTPSEDNVLFVIKQADTLSPDFDISNIVHYSFGDYLKCITVSGTELCDNWMYKVNGDSPMVGMDSYALSGSENIVLYFGDEDKAPEPEPTPEPISEPETPPAQPTHSSGGGGGRITLNTVCEQGAKFSPTTGQPCTSFVPSPSPVSSTPVSPTSNTNLEEKPKIQTVAVKTPEKTTEIKPTNLASQNTASAINAVPQTPPVIQTEVPKKNWWSRFWDNIFSIF